MCIKVVHSYNIFQVFWSLIALCEKQSVFYFQLAVLMLTKTKNIKIVFCNLNTAEIKYKVKNEN